MTNSVAIFSNDTAVVSYSNKKGDQFTTSIEGALFKGGRALASLKDAAKLSAYNKAESGRYRAASDILGASFPTLAKAFEKGTGMAAWNSKFSMGLFLDRLESYRPKEGKDFTQKQRDALDFVAALRGLNALASDKPAMVVEG